MTSTTTAPTTPSKKRKSTDTTSPPTKRQKVNNSSLLRTFVHAIKIQVDTSDQATKPALANKWTRTDPVTNEAGRLQRKDVKSCA